MNDASPPAESVAAVPSHRGLMQRALSLGAANAFDYATQFLLPVVLVRFLDRVAFGNYRMLWLAAGTALSFATLAMPASLFYFLPRSDGPARRLYINQTLAFLTLAGLICGWAVSAWNPWLPAQMSDLAQHDIVVPAFLVLWIAGSLLDLLPTIEERVAWQARATVLLATLRAGSISAAAVLTHSLNAVLVVLLFFVLCKVGLLLGYLARYHGLRGPLLRPRSFADQFRYAAPFGIAGALYVLRVQADQWVGAMLFSLERFASLSIAGILAPLVTLLRQSVNNAFLPSMSRLQACGDNATMLALNSRANVVVGALVFPLLALVMAFAEDLVSLVYTNAYVDAAPILRVYAVGVVALVVELATLSLLLRQGRFMVVLNLVLLGAAVACSWFGARHVGLAGAALGSVATIYVDRILTLRRISQLTGTPLRRLQDWGTLGLLMVFAALAAALAYGIVERFVAEDGHLVRLAVGGATLAAAYCALCGVRALHQVRLRARQEGARRSAPT
ncbi:MAG TPA: oligosaccharide flippase family protein [Steroidobacteraceae bacterium]|nr:oligosaccharide flippase family protein [Steroidobacteraceae bacterium]